MVNNSANDIDSEDHTKVTTPERTSSLGSTSHHPFPYFAHKTAILGQKVLKIHANIISALNVTFQTGSRNEPGSHMRTEKYAITP